MADERTITRATASGRRSCHWTQPVSPSQPPPSKRKAVVAALSFSCRGRATRGCWEALCPDVSGPKQSNYARAILGPMTTRRWSHGPRGCEQGGALPLAETIPGLGGYETVFLGFPVLGVDLPTVMASFLQRNDLAGKTVVPFVTRGDYGTGDALACNLAPAAQFLD
ncbi:hypothetical protein GIY56_16700 [Paracoccus sp. YIM 132242]|uniref:Flavodoxin-like domain-containing protein n=1 Tax=Paracoccus lichenicola TaxID=2665644 RepID=A0A6L6HUH9_9RHOB|nr:flavodoxin [Paracoccus lichenicola]MTE01931.1 hypothetical protein [Paracoccus lichenicola]